MQPQQNPKLVNYIKETHKQVHAITTLRSEKEIDKIITPKGVNQGEDESKRLGHETESKKSESKKDKGKEKEHEIHSKPSNKASNEVTMKDLKYAPFLHRLTKASKANLNAKIYNNFKQVRINIPMLDAIKQIPSYSKFLKDFCTFKRKLHVKKTAMMNKSQSVIL